MRKFIEAMIPFLMMVACNSANSIDNELVTKKSYCLDNYESLMLTVSELVTEKFFNEQKLEDYETIQIDTTSALLHVKYRFKYNVDDFHMLLNNVIIFEKTQGETKSTYDYYERTLESGVNSSETRKRWGTNKIDRILSFGEESHAYEYRKDEHTTGYLLMGRTKNVMVIYSIQSDHVTHHDFVEKLMNRIETIKKITSDRVRVEEYAETKHKH